MPTPSGLSPRVKLAIALFLLSLLSWFWTHDRSLLRLALADFPCWQEGLRAQAGLYRDQPELLGFADQSPSALEDWVTRGQRVEVRGEAWEGLFTQMREVQGRSCRDLPSAVCRRVSPREDDWVNGLFFAPDEPPFASFSQLPDTGEAIYLYLEETGDVEPLQLLSIPEGQSEGKVQGCRWYYDHWQIPIAFSHPLRRYGVWLLGLGLLVLFWEPLGRAVASLGTNPGIIDPKLVNHRKQSARISFGVTLVLFVGLTGTLAWDPYADYVPPLIFVGGFIFLMALITTGILWRSALRLDRVFLGEELLLRLEYPPDVWRHHVEKLFQERSQASRRMLAVVGVLMLVIGGGFALIMQDGASLFSLGVLAGVFVLLILVAVWSPRRQRRTLLAHPALVLVARGGVYMAGEFHDFRVMETRLEGAAVTREEAGDFLRIAYSYQSRNSRQSAQVAIPLPPGQLEAARRVAEELNRGG